MPSPRDLRDEEDEATVLMSGSQRRRFLAEIEAEPTPHGPSETAWSEPAEGSLESAPAEAPAEEARPLWFWALLAGGALGALAALFAWLR